MRGQGYVCLVFAQGSATGESIGTREESEKKACVGPAKIANNNYTVFPYMYTDIITK